MPYIVRNQRPSSLHIPDAGLRLDPGEMVTVAALSPQLVQLSALGFVAITGYVTIPPPVTAADARRQQVISLQRQGATPREIVAALPMSRRQVSRLRRALATAEAPFAAANPLPALLLAFVKPNSATGNAKQYMTRQIGVREFEIKQ